MATAQDPSEVEMEEDEDRPEAEHPDLQLWRHVTRGWFPELLSRAYFVPPCHMHKTEHEEITLPSGRVVLRTKQPLETRARGMGSVLVESDVRDDQCQQTVLDCLRRLSQDRNEVMFVISQLRFGHYLNMPCYAAAAETLPKPAQLKLQNNNQGDFDVLVIHRRHGILVGEIKAVGDAQSQQEDADKILNKKLKQQVLKQLTKADEVMRHLTKHFRQQCRLLKTVMLPNIKRADLTRVLENDPQLKRDLSACLGLDSADDDPAAFCLTADDVIDPSKWWQCRVTSAGDDPAMNDDTYLELITRFAGPATTVKVFCSSAPRLSTAHRSDVRTPGEGVSEAGNRFAPVDIVLHPTQVDILNDDSLRLVYVTGPPGTGKTLVLVLKGQEWLRRGKPVHVVSARKDSRSASYMIAHQLQKAEPESRQRVRFQPLHVPTNWTQGAARLAAAAEVDASGERELYVIVDEAWDCYAKEDNFRHFIRELQRQVRNLHVWSAALYHACRPEGFTEVRLTEALRTPPTLTRLVADHRGFLGNYVYRYTAVPSPAPSDGHPVHYLYHQGPLHELQKDTPQCKQCGRDIAEFLRHLHVGQPARSDDAPLPPRYRDVFILTYGSRLQPNSGLIQGLRSEGFPVRVLTSSDDSGIRQVAAMAGPDQITAADSVLVNGLERKVVIFVQHDRQSEDWGKLWAMSRCTAQLAWLSRPRAHSEDMEH